MSGIISKSKKILWAGRGVDSGNVRITQDGRMETDTRANQYQLATEADNQIQCRSNITTLRSRQKEFSVFSQIVYYKHSFEISENLVTSCLEAHASSNRKKDASLKKTDLFCDNPSRAQSKG